MHKGKDVVVMIEMQLENFRKKYSFYKQLLHTHTKICDKVV